MWFVSIISSNQRASAFPINSLEAKMLHVSGQAIFISQLSLKHNEMHYIILEGVENRNSSFNKRISASFSYI